MNSFAAGLKRRAGISAPCARFCRLYDKMTGRTVIDGECRALLLDESTLNTWGHDAVYLGKEVDLTEQ